jgi:DMSO/TMAO reductase YedYZ molybdopterin-dependent catalytic subunit
MQAKMASRVKWALLAVSVAAMVTTGTLLIAGTPAKEEQISITIAGRVNDPTTVDLADLKSQESVTVTAELICVSGISSGTHNWTGVRLKALLAEAGVQADVIKVAFTASDHYTTDLTLEDAMRDDIIIAYLEDGSPMSEKTRLVVPGKWGYKWISDLVKIELVDYDFLGKWEQRGYTDDATITQ